MYSKGVLPYRIAINTKEDTKEDTKDDTKDDTKEDTTTNTTTENGAISLATTGSNRVNLFFKLVRDCKYTSLTELFHNSWEEDPLDTVKIIFHARDCRGGKGDRNPFLELMRYLAMNKTDVFLTNLEQIPKYGRWLDLIEIYSLLESENINNVVNIDLCKEAIIKHICDQFKEDRDRYLKSRDYQCNTEISLLAKWFPGENKKWDKCSLRKIVASRLFSHLNLKNQQTNNKLLRIQYISPLREYIRIVERKMCQRQWDKIAYSTVPSCAIKRYKDAFSFHDKERFEKWLDDVKNKKQKINSAQIYPHELVNYYLNRNEKDDVIEEQWKNIIEQYDSPLLKNTVVLSDVSSSMEGIPMQVSVALGILISNIAKTFHKRLITFSEHPQVCDFSNEKSLYEQVSKVSRMDWGGSTNFEAVLQLILNETTNNSNHNPIDTLIVLSDMQFNEADVNISKLTHFQIIKQRYKKANIPFPKIVFWNLRGDTNSREFPVSANEYNVIMLSGYSPSLLNSVLSGEDITPYKAMRDAIDNERYSTIQLKI